MGIIVTEKINIICCLSFTVQEFLPNLKNLSIRSFPLAYLRFYAIGHTVVRGSIIRGCLARIYFKLLGVQLFVFVRFVL